MTAPTLTGRDHETGVDGACIPECLACYVGRLEKLADAVRAGLDCYTPKVVLDALRALDGEPQPVPLLATTALRCAVRAGRQTPWTASHE